LDFIVKVTHILIFKDSAAIINKELGSILVKWLWNNNNVKTT